MPRASIVDRSFAAAEQAKIAAFLDAHPHVSVSDFRAYLAERGCEISRGGAHAAKKRLEDVGRKLREGRMFLDAVGEGLDRTDESRRTRALLETVKVMFAEFQLRQMDGAELDAGDFRSMAGALRDIAAASRADQDFAGRVADEERRKAAEAAGAAARELGIGGDAEAAIRRAIEGGR